MDIQSLADVAASLRSPELTRRDLYTVWERRQPAPEPDKGEGKDAAADSVKQIAWLQDDLATAVEFVARALEKEEFLLVCDCAREALRFWDDKKAIRPRDHFLRVRLRMQYAAVLARLGYTPEARKQLEPCVAASFQPPLDAPLKAEMLVQLGNFLREDSACAPLRAARDQIAEQALEFYLRALQVDPDRLDAMTLAAAAGFVISRPGSNPRRLAQEHAKQVLIRAQEIERTAGAQYHLTYFRAVAQAVLGFPDEAAASFETLAGLEGATTTHLADARYWARTLAEALDLNRDFFRPAFPPLQLIVFSGHLPDRLDRPDRPSRFPLSAAGQVSEMLDDALAEARASVGMVSAAAGADLLFVEALRKRKDAAFHLVLPWEQEEFQRTSVAPFEPFGQPPLWRPMFDEAIKQASTVRVIGQMYRPKDDATLVYTTEVTAGLALHTARAMRLDILPMALWDGQPGRIAGGTDDFVKFWRQLGYQPKILKPPAQSVETIVDPRADLRVGVAPPAPEMVDGTLVRCERKTLQQEVKTMLFADIVGYSKLNEAVIPQFVGVFLEAVSRLTGASAHAPRHLNTWGDAIYAVFDFAQDAGCFATELIQLIRDNQEEWTRQGLCWTETRPNGETVLHPLNIRVGLHTGPVFLHYNPMVRQLGYTGVHVSRAARIEPVTPPGEVFASEEFAALAELDRAMRQERLQLLPLSKDKPGEALSFVCEYAGSMVLAKGYPGRHRLYRVVPHRVFALEELAKVIHADYCAVEAGKGHTLATNPSMEAWETLPEHLRDSNRAQAADVPRKLEAMGYELAPSFGLPPSAILLTEAKVEELAMQEHERWMREKLRVGWRPGPKRDAGNKIHECLVAWEELSEENKEKDRVPVRNVPRLVEKAGFRVRKIV